MKTMRRYPLLVKLLESFGIENKRIRLEWVSAAEGEKFSNVVKDFTSVVKKLGPLNWKAIENQIKPAEIMVEKEKPSPGVEEVRI
jgi:coenzyme F420-reducing hydrogenase delta subunit